LEKWTPVWFGVGLEKRMGKYGTRVAILYSVFCLQEKKEKKLMIANEIQCYQQTNIAEMHCNRNIKGVCM